MHSENSEDQRNNSEIIAVILRWAVAKSQDFCGEGQRFSL
jgi:hypothetical protein